MVRNLFFIVISMVLLNTVYSQSADEIIDKHYEAIGGKEIWKSITTLKTTGNVSMGPMVLNFTSYQVSPDKFRMDVDMQGQSLVQLFDGTDGWMLNPFKGDTKFEKVDKETAKGLKEKGNIAGKLMTYKEDGAQITYLGKETVDSVEVYKIKYQDIDGDFAIYFIDTETFMINKLETERTIQGKNIATEVIFGDFKTTGKVILPFEIVTTTSANRGMVQKVTIEKVEFDVEVDKGLFDVK